MAMKKSGGRSAAQARVRTDVERKKNSETVAQSESEETVGVGFSGDIEEPCLNLNVTGGLTRNLGNYESVRFGVSITVPCAHNDSAIESTFAWAKGFVKGRVEQLDKEWS